MALTVDCGTYDPANATVATIKVYESPEGKINRATGRPRRAGWWYEVSIDGHRESAWTSGGERNAWAKAMAALGRRLA